MKRFWQWWKSDELDPMARTLLILLFVCGEIVLGLTVWAIWQALSPPPMPTIHITSCIILYNRVPGLHGVYTYAPIQVCP